VCWAAIWQPLFLNTNFSEKFVFSFVMSPQGMALVFLAVAALSMHVRGIATASQAPAGQGAALAEGLSRLNGATDRAGSSLSGTRGAAMAQWVKMAEEQGEIVRKIKDEMRADTASHTKEELDAAVAKLKELKTKADDPMNALEDPVIKGKFDLVRSVGEECVTDGELAMLMARKPDSFVLYDGFEPSGRMHIAQGVFKAMNVNKCTRAGGTFIFWVADWFALMNDKMGGDLDKIKTVGKYLVEVWKATGMNMERVKFVWSSHEICNHSDAYWTQALDIARKTTIARVKKCCQIMGRLENKLTAAQILYPLMQATDIFFLQADICQLGVDQRKVNMLAREYCDTAGIKIKPIILSHHMLLGLKKGQEKMSKSDPDSAIFMEDTVEDVARKLGNAYCPDRAEEGDDKKAPTEGEVDAGLESMHLVETDLKNPCLDYIEHIIFSVPGQVLACGGVDYKCFSDVKEAFVGGKLDEGTLKAALIDAVNKLLDPVRKHFTENAEAKALLAQIIEWKKADLKPPPGLKRLVAVDATKGPVWAVVAPPANENLNLGELCSVLRQLSAAPAGQQIVLWCPDWTSFVLNRCGGEKKVIAACYTLLVEALAALKPDLMSRVSVLMQSEAILKALSPIPLTRTPEPQTLNPKP
jgi:tyrosyl-tRNA synthetase